MSPAIRKTILYYILLRAITGFGIGFINATHVTFLIAKGLNLFEVSMVEFVFYGTLLLFELPTGAFADMFGRKLSYVLSCFIFGLGMFLYAGASSFGWFALAEGLAAIGATFANGAFQAWLYDRLLVQGYVGSKDIIFAREQQARGMMGMIAAILGASLAEINISLPWIATGTMMFVVGTLAALFMKEEWHHKAHISVVESIKAMFRMIRSGIRQGRSNSAVRVMVVMGLAQYFAFQAPNMQWQPYFQQFITHTRVLGYICSGTAIAVLIGSSCAPWFLRRTKNHRTALIFCQIIIGLGICLTTLSGNFALGLVAFFVHEAARGLFLPLKDAYLNDHIPSAQRATLISFENISHHIGGLIGLLATGLMAQYISMRFAWIFVGSLLVISALWQLKKKV